MRTSSGRSGPTIDTPYPIGGVTQAFTGVLIGVCIDRFRIDNRSARHSQLSSRRFRSRTPACARCWLMRPTGASVTTRRYYSSLTAVVESKDVLQPELPAGDGRRKCSNKLALTRSVPGLDLARADGVAARALFDEATVQRYQSGARRCGGAVSPRCEGPQFPIGIPVVRTRRVERPGVDRQRSRASFRSSSRNRRFNGVPLSFSTLDKMWGNTSFTFNRPSSVSRRQPS